MKFSAEKNVKFNAEKIVDFLHEYLIITSILFGVLITTSFGYISDMGLFTQKLSENMILWFGTTSIINMFIFGLSLTYLDEKSVSHVKDILLGLVGYVIIAATGVFIDVAINTFDGAFTAENICITFTGISIFILLALIMKAT